MDKKTVAKKSPVAPAAKTTRKPVSKSSKDSSTHPHRRLRKFTNYNVYVKSILKQTHKDLGLKQRSADVMNSLIRDIAETITKEAVRFKGVAKRRTLSAHDVRLAVSMLYPRGLSEHVLLLVDNALAQHQAATPKPK